MTDQEVQVLLEYLKRHYPEIYKETMNHVREFTDFMDNQLQMWIDMRSWSPPSIRSSFTPSLSKLKINDRDDHDTVNEWLSSPTPNKTDPELLKRLAEKGLF
jgi:hypothetical protein